MKKIVFCLVTLLLALPITSFAEETLSTSESATADSMKSTELKEFKLEDSSLSIETASSSTETSGTSQTAYGELLPTTLVVFQGEKVTADMLTKDAGYHGAALRDLTLLEEAPTDQLGKNLVKAHFMIYPLENQQEKQEVTLNMEYLVVKPEPTFTIQFISYNKEKGQVKGRLLSIDGASTADVSINATEQSAATIKTLYPALTNSDTIVTDAEGYFVMPYKNGLHFAALSLEMGAYSPVYTLTDEAFADVEETADTTKVENSTASSTTKKEEKKGAFPNTGENQTIYFSIAGIAVILLAFLLLFIRSKKK